MKYRRLGNSELMVSEVALGSWLTYGVHVEPDQARTCVHRARDLGINLFDTANMYGYGATESLLGGILSEFPRDSYLLATKVYFPMSETDRGLSREQIHKQIDGSLRRLRTDHVDLYQCHRYDDDVPLEETMEALGEVVDAGKARYIGISRWKPKQIRAAKKLDGRGCFVSSQPQYSMLHRTPERRVFPTCAELGIGQIVYSPLAQGILTGKYAPDQPAPEDSRAATEPHPSKRFQRKRLLRAVQRLHPIAHELGISMAQMALAWVLRDQRVAAAIIGASRPEQIEHNVGAVGVTLDPGSLDAIDATLQEVVRA